MFGAIMQFVAVMVASYVLNSALAARNKTTTPEAATSDDWEMPQPEEGTPQCVFFGDAWTEDWFVLAYGNYRYEAIKK
ncbi:hypothetical protein ACV3J7_07325 [Salmonella enterica]